MHDLRTRTLASLEDRLNQIGILAGVARRLMAMDLGSPRAADEMIALVRTDPALALRLVRLANAANSGGSGRVNSIPEAILRVGTRTLAEWLLSSAVIEVFLPHTTGQRNLWIHCIQTAVWSRRLAEMTPERGVHPEHAYLAGLLHDIGRFFMFQHDREQLGAIEESEFERPSDLVAAEVLMCGFDHAELGGHVCRRWLASEHVTEMVRHHHVHGEGTRRIPPEVLTLVHTVQQADHLSWSFLRGSLTLSTTPADRVRDIERTLASLDPACLLVSAARVADQLHRMDETVRATATLVDLAYEGVPPAEA